MAQILHLPLPGWLLIPLSQRVLTLSEVSQIAFVEMREESTQQVIDWPDILHPALNKLMLDALELTMQ